MSLEIITLHDDATGSSASILPGRGLNCYSFQSVHGGKKTEALWSVPDFATGGGRASGSGNPLLFPFAGRLRGTRFRFRGRTYEVPAGDAHGNAIHGFVIDRPWDVVDQSATRVVARFQASKIEPQILRMWPEDFLISITYELSGNTLDMLVDVQNPGSGPLPFGFGTHPYFCVPLGEGGKSSACSIKVPAVGYWELAEMIPTGRKLPLIGARNMTAGLPFDEVRLDDVLCNLSYEGGLCVTSIVDRASGRTMVQTFGPEFRECVVYTPPHREAICIEPYSCAPDAFALAEQGIDAGMTILEPGQRWSGRVTIRVD
ncbi:MAG: aldose 1-epimerase [Pirellulales bacterium]|nr:aldose 1-epimerase [Pirellulales bacterium]